MKQNKKDKMKEEDLSKSKETEERLRYILNNTKGGKRAFAVWIVIHWHSIERVLKVGKACIVLVISIFVINFTVQVIAGASLFETILNWNTNAFVTTLLSRNSSKELSLNYTETGIYKEFKDVENRLNVELLKLNYIPDRFKFEKITVAEDESSTNFRISAIYSDKNDNTSLIYNAYVGRNASVNLQVIQEKMQENPIIGHFKLNNIDIPYNIFENTNWYSVTWSYNNIVYELYGIKSKDELIKVIDNVSLKIN